MDAKFLRFTITACGTGEPCIDELEAFTGETPPRNVALASAGAVATASGVYANGTNAIHQTAHINDGQYGNAHSWISNERGKGWVQIEFQKPERIQRVSWSRDRGSDERVFDDRVATGYRIEVSLDGNEWKTVASSDNRLSINYAKQNPVALAAAAGVSKAKIDEVLKVLAYRAKVQERVKTLSATGSSAYVGQFEQPFPTFVLNRGDPMQKREPAPPGALSLIGSTLTLDVNSPERERRVALANWIADPKNPLTARVMANRLWHYHFGTGIVDTPSDFGANGGRPTHRNGIEFVIVAARAIHGERQKRGACRGHHIVELVGALLGGQHRIGTLHQVHRPADKKSRRLVRAERVAGQLFADEFVIGQISVERTDHVVAVRPRVGARLIHFEPVALRKAHDVQPMPRPAFAISRRGEKFVDEPLDGVRRRIRHERVDFFRRRRQPDHIEIHAPNPRAPISLLGKHNPAFA